MRNKYFFTKLSFYAVLLLLSIHMKAVAQVTEINQIEIDTVAAELPLEPATQNVLFNQSTSNCISPQYIEVYIRHSDKLGFRWNAVTPTPSLGYEYDISQTNTPPTSNLETNETFSTEVSYGSLEANTTYYFWVRSICDGQFGPWISSGPVSTLPYKCVNAPDGEINSSSIAISCGGGFQQITNLPISPSFYAKITILPNKTYAFKSSIPTDYITVAAFNGIDMSIYAHGQGTVYWNSYNTSGSLVRFYVHSSANCGVDNSEIRYRYVSCQDEISSCAPPSGLSVGSVTSTSAVLDWDASSVTPIGGYDVYLSTSSETPLLTATPLANTSSSVTTYPLLNLQGNTTYYAWIRSNCIVYLGDWTPSISFTTPSTPTCPTPFGLQTANVTSNSASISWTAPQSAILESYVYYVSTSPTPPTDSTVPTGSTFTNIVDLSSLSPQTTYYFWVQSICDSLTSVWSSGSSFTTTATTFCTNAVNGQIPTNTVTPSCTGSPQTLAAVTSTGSYSVFNLSANTTYVLASSVATDYWTITNNTGTQVLIEGTTPMEIVVGATGGLIRAYLHANNNCGVSLTPRSTTISCPAPVSPCQTPSVTAPTNVTFNSATLNWSNSATPSNGYQIYYSTSSVPPTASTVPQETATGLTKTITSLSASTTYYYWIRANCGANFSNWTSTSSFTTAADTTCPTPFNLQVSELGPISATLNWQIQNDSGYTFDVLVRLNNVAPTINTTPSFNINSNSAFYAGNNIEPNKTYYWWVRTNCGATKSPWVAGGSFTTPIPTNCSQAFYFQYPQETVVPTCNNTSQIVEEFAITGDFSVLTASANRQYTFSTTIATDFITISNANNTAVLASGTTPLVWLSGNYSGNIRYVVHENSLCATDTSFRTKSVSCTTNLSIEAVDYEVFKLFPNPTTDLVTIMSDKTIESINIYNQIGQLLAVFQPNNSETVFSTSSYAAGIYFVEVKTENGTLTSRLLKK
ncbi:fibronectin type III domain-containing protein [Flavobacterium aurantiibacter]|uniref:Fibronectin type-III domain-containing protein n=1 Tax=Flavobacterium aurantiibacter TaxID=2023067 RepID=A0A255ZMV3_9FLAO|nr:fibronectin type III domain-containing protein [Flavobacterium aurantiibacter]OYQ41983.1 hypothetical protein CHX27_12515 [Flavobacterium aurantiibacter]OYQ42897.1 hypothetical protein CHX27_11410 [Flavobacterium aurantiibacter]